MLKWSEAKPEEKKRMIIVSAIAATLIFIGAIAAIIFLIDCLANYNITKPPE